MECITQRQSGFHFLGKDYYEIIKYLGLERFTISSTEKVPSELTE